MEIHRSYEYLGSHAESGLWGKVLHYSINDDPMTSGSHFHVRIWETSGKSSGACTTGSTWSYKNSVVRLLYNDAEKIRGPTDSSDITGGHHMPSIPLKIHHVLAWTQSLPTHTHNTNWSIRKSMQGFPLHRETLVTSFFWKECICMFEAFFDVCKVSLPTTYFELLFWSHVKVRPV